MCVSTNCSDLRPLRKSRKSLLASFFRVQRRQSGLIFLQVQDVFALLATFASQRRHVSSATALEDSLFQIEGHGIEQELQFDLGRPEIPGTKEAVTALERTEGAFHL